MTIDKYNKAQSLLKGIAVVKDKLDMFPKFLNAPLITDVRLVTPQNATLSYMLDREDLENMIIYLQLKYEAKLEKLEEEFENL